MSSPTKPNNLDSLYDSAMTIGTRFRQLRRHLNLSGEQIGEICGVSKGMVSHWESGNSIPTTDRLIELKNKHPFSIDWLLTGQGDMIQPDQISEAARHMITRLSTMTEREQYRIIRMVDAFADDATINDSGESKASGEHGVER